MPKSPVTGTLKGKRLTKEPSNQPAQVCQEDDNLTLKAEAVRALGLFEKVKKHGWGALTAAENGRIGGYMTRIRFAAKRQQEQDSSHNSS